MTIVPSYDYATLKPWGLYSYVPSFIILRLVVAYEGLLEIIHHNLRVFKNKLVFQEYVYVAILDKEELR